MSKKEDSLFEEAKKIKAELDELKRKKRESLKSDKIKPRTKSRQVKFAEEEVRRYEKLGIKNSSSKISEENKSEYEFYKMVLKKDDIARENFQNQLRQKKQEAKPAKKIGKKAEVKPPKVETTRIVNKPQRTCKGICEKFKVKKPTGKSRYGSGQGHCQICDTWVGHNGCHMKDGSSSLEMSVGWFCNCCNYRVRQKPRNKIYKEKLRNESDGLFEYIEIDDEIKAKNLDISKGQANLLKKILVSFPKKDQDGNSLDIYNKISESEKYEISDNWKSWETFYEFATNYNELNQISAIIQFEKLNEEIGYVASKKEFLEITNVDELWIDKKFKTWENFLELLGHDPWYRNKSKSVEKYESQEEIDENKSEEHEKIKWKNFESIDKIFENLNKLKTELIEDYNIKYSKNEFREYSHVEMLNLLEKYLKILPNDTRYSEIKNFF